MIGSLETLEKYNQECGGTITRPLETQVGGDHYTKMKIQPLEYILANELGYCEANIVKYVSRYQSKNGVEDLKKARHYLDILIEKVQQDS